MLDAALRYVTAGLSIVPIALNGNKKPSCSWKEYQTTPATEETVREWYATGQAGIAVVAGRASGNVEVLDFDDEEVGAAWLHPMRERHPDLLDRLTQVRTPRPGLHVWYRVAGFPVPGNQKIARDADGKTTLVETRGEGGYALVPGGALAAHPTGRPYEHVAGPGFDALAVLTVEEWGVLHELARSLDRSPPAQEAISPPPAARPGRRRSARKGGRPSVHERARLYLRNAAPSISGQGGHPALLWAARIPVRGFLLSREESLDILRTDFNPFCQPEWSEQELLHKIEEAATKPFHLPLGWLLEEEPGDKPRPTAQQLDETSNQIKAELLAAMGRINRTNQEFVFRQMGLPPFAGDLYPFVGRVVVTQNNKEVVRFCHGYFDGASRPCGIAVFKCPDEATRAHRLEQQRDRFLLHLAKGWLDCPGPVYVVEGLAEMLAMSCAGLATLGVFRFDSNGCRRALAGQLSRVATGRDIVFVGRDDPRENGTNPGTRAAYDAAVKVGQVLGRNIHWAVLPATTAAGPLAFLRARGAAVKADVETWQRAGQELRTALAGWTQTVLVEPATQPSTVVSGPGADTPTGRPVGVQGTPTTPPAPSAPNSLPASGQEPHVNEAPDDPHRVANSVLRLYRAARPHGFVHHAGEYLLWEMGRYRPVEDKMVDAVITRWLKDIYNDLNIQAIDNWRRSGAQGRPPVVKQVSRKRVGDIRAVLQALAILPATPRYSPPAWLCPEPHPCPASNVVACSNGLLQLPGWGEPGDDVLFHEPNPAYFNRTTIGVPFDENAPEPREWLRFLRSVWPDDPESIRALRQWFGYLIAGELRLQKSLMLIGEKRSGKGTILRIIEGVVGPANYAAPTLASLAERFGLEDMLNKTVACVADSRISGKTDIAPLIERMLSITGQDAITVDRKNKTALTTRLGIRIVVASNEVPKLTDASGAAASRFVVLRFSNSFLNREDEMLMDRLRPELPGILRWAICGWLDLRQAGRFLQPQTGQEDLQLLMDLGSNVGAFARSCIIADSNAEAHAKELYTEWKKFCEETGAQAGQEAVFVRNLRAVMPGIKKIGGRVRVPYNGESVRTQYYKGLRLRTDEDDRRDAENTSKSG